MQRKVMTVISENTLKSLSNHIAHFQLKKYDTAKYRKTPQVEKWVGRKLVGLPIDTLALVATEGVDAIGKYVSLHMAVPVNQPLQNLNNITL